ncbi:hypothetical protein CHS0354_019448 [Potamilus streckersoni]|uniref:Spermatogenesis-associated protein 1 C-terminal domain-containing protein n=1 Tax=Potamilus streckersoni TaxID=2493646 RepID=A0AAE0VWU5_9BIVA|nr:hypothetical protein CHS0354_019448 [Potamilus streckersoni]
MSSRMNGYRSDRGMDRDRPPSEQLVDLHVYIVPPDIWREKFNNALNQNINDTVSVGLIRVHPETKVFVLRDEIEQQLGTEVIPREYVFLKSVGRSLTRLKSKQEYQMKAKHFLPPNAYAPEIYLLEATPEVRAALAASSEGSTRPQTQTSLEYETYRPNYGPAKRNDRHHGNSEGQHLQTDKSSAISSSVGVASSFGASTVGGGGAGDAHSLQIQSPLPKIQPPSSYRQQQSYSPVGQSRTPPLQLQPSSAQSSPPQHSSERKDLQPPYKPSAPPAALTSQHDSKPPLNFPSTTSLHVAPHAHSAQDSVLPIDNMHVQSDKHKPGMIHVRERDGLDEHTESTQKGPREDKFLYNAPMVVSAYETDLKRKKGPFDVKRKPDENYIKIRQNAQLNLKEQSRRHQKEHDTNDERESYAQSRPYQEHVSTDQRPGYAHVGVKQVHVTNDQTYSSKQVHVSKNNLQKLQQPGQNGSKENISSSSQALKLLTIPDKHENFPANVYTSESSYREYTQDSTSEYLHRTYHVGQNVNTNSHAPVSYSSKVSTQPVFQLATKPPDHLGRRPYFKSPPATHVDVPPITSPRRDDYLPPLSATPPPPPPPIASRAKHSRHESPAKVFDRPTSIVHNHIIDDSGLAGYSPVNTYRENNDVLDRRRSSLKSDILQEKLIEKPEPEPDESREKRTPGSEVIQEHYITKPEPESEEKRKRSPETEVIQEHFVEKPEPEREEKRKLEPEPQLIHQRHKTSRNEEEAERQRREEEERRRREEEERRRREQEEHDHLDWERQKREEEERRRHEEEARRRREDEERRRKEEEREKYAEMNRMKSGSDDDLAKFPSPPPPPIGSPKTRQTSAERRRKKGEKEKLLRELEAAREARHAAERQREELVKKAKQMQSKTQSRRNHAKLDSRGKAARDLWKKRYFDEKKKTIPLDEQCNKLRHELDIIHKKLISTLEGPKEKATKLQEIKPSLKSASLGTSPNNYKIQATRLAHELEDLKRRVENSKMRLTGEMKLRNQAETELRALRAELTQKKINLTLSRNSHLTAFAPPAADIPFVTPRQAAITPRS